MRSNSRRPGRGRILGAVLAVALGAGTATDAHHSYGAMYDVKQTVTLRGALVEFAFRNPHSSVTMRVPGTAGAAAEWSLEWGAAAQLADSGITQRTFEPGDEIVVLGNPSRRRGERRALLIALRRPSDGLIWGVRAGELAD